MSFSLGFRNSIGIYSSIASTGASVSDETVEPLLSEDAEDVDICTFCGGDGDVDYRLWIEDIGTLLYCEICIEEIVDEVRFIPPKWFFVVKPRRKSSGLDREIFETVEEFEDWCKENEEYQDCYTFGMYKSSIWDRRDRQTWLNGSSMEMDFYWLENTRDENHGEVLASMYRDGGNDLWSWDTLERGLICTPNNKDSFIEDQISKLDAKICRLEACKTRLKECW